MLSLTFEASLAVSPRAAAAGSQSVPRVLVFYAGCFVSRSNGSQARVASQIQHLLDSSVSVSVYSYVGSGDQEWRPTDIEAFRRMFPNVELVLEREGAALRLARGVKKALVQLSPRLTGAIVGFGVPGATPELERWKRANPDAVFIVNYVDGVSRMNGVPLSRVVIETHDFQYFRRAKDLAASLFSVRGLMRLRQEVAVLSAAAGVVAISRTEEYVYRNLAPRSRVYFVPLYERVREQVDTPLSASHQFDLLFVGSSNKVNEQGLLQFVTACPWLRRYRIAVCGKICEVESIRTLASNENNLKLLGFQDDLSSIYLSSKACICPTNGTGLNIKILEALSHGKAVFASKEAIEALPGGFEGCVFFLDPARIEALLCDAPALQAAGNAARDYYRSIPESGDLARLDAHLRELSGGTLLEVNSVR